MEENYQELRFDNLKIKTNASKHMTDELEAMGIGCEDDKPVEVDINERA